MGPATKLKKRLERGDCGINPLDSACKEHDIAYAKNLDVKNRNLADKHLAGKAWERVLAKDSTLEEKLAAYTVANIMNIKTKFGMGLTVKKKTNKKKKKSRKKTKILEKRTLLSILKN